MRVLASVLAWAAVSAVATAQPLADRVDAVVQAAHTAGAFDGVVVLARGDTVLYAGAVGLAERAFGAPMTVETRFPVASVTKQVAAVVALQLVAEGRLALEAPVERYVPGLVDPRIRVADLLRHTSGLPDPGAAAQAAYGCSLIAPSPDSLLDARAFVRAFTSGPLAAEPGSETRYNNAEYHVLQAVVEAVAGEPFAALVEARIAGPLAMTDTRVADGTVEPRLAASYAGEAPGPCFAVPRFGAAGALVSTAPDLARFGAALMAGQLLPAALRDTLWASGSETGWAAMGQWVYSKRLADGRAARIVERQGSLGAYEALHVLLPDAGLALVVLKNAGTASLFGLAWQSGLPDSLLEALLTPDAAPGATGRP